jgi:hypothetical protein
MHYRLAAVLFLMVGLGLAGASLIYSQDNPPKDEKQAEKQEEKKQEKKQEKVDDAEKPLTSKEYSALMEDEVKDAWNKLKINHRNKRGEQAAASADSLAGTSPKILRYDGEVLKGDNKGKKARDQKDFQGWAADLKKHAEEYARHARKGDWDKAEKSKDKINETCGHCHDAYEPEG